MKTNSPLLEISLMSPRGIVVSRSWRKTPVMIRFWRWLRG